MPELETPPAENKAPTAFAAALDKALKGEGASDTPPAPTPKEKKEPAQDKPPENKEPEQKSGPPRDLFKKAEPAKGKEEPPSNEPKSALDEIAAPEFKDEKGKKGWDALKAKASEYEKKALALEREIAERKAAGRDTETLEARLAEREKQIKEMDSIVARARIEDHPAFRAEFIEGRDKLVAKAKTIVDNSGGDAKQIEVALNLTGKAQAEALSEIAKDMDTFSAGRLARVVEEMASLDERAQAKRADAKKSYDDLREQERTREAEANANRQKTRGVLFEDTVSKLRGDLEVLQVAEGHTEWNARAERIIKDARAFVDANPGADIEAEIYSRALPAYRDLFIEADTKAEKLEKENSEMRKELETIHGKSPSLRPSGGGGGGGDKSRTPFSDALKKQMGGAE